MGVTKSKGLESLQAIKEDAKFPATKNELIEKQGWKVFDLTEIEHEHASILLEKLPDRIFGSVDTHTRLFTQDSLLSSIELIIPPVNTIPFFI